MERPIEVFISYKNTDANGNRTRESRIAEELYAALIDKRIAAFYSNVNLLKLGQAVYKKSIDDALNNAKLLVVISDGLEHLNSNWVEYEWNGFHSDILSGVKPSGVIVPYLANISTSQCPRPLRNYETFNIDTSGINIVTDFIVACLNDAKIWKNTTIISL